MQADNSMATNCPISETDLLETARKYLENDSQDLQASITEFINALQPLLLNYKILVNVVQLQSPSGAFCVSGAHWDTQQDGTWVKGLGKNLVTVSWIKG